MTEKGTRSLDGWYKSDELIIHLLLNKQFTSDKGRISFLFTVTEVFVD